MLNIFQGCLYQKLKTKSELVTPSIIIENLSKQYRLGQVGTGTLSHDLNRWWHIIIGKEDPYLKIGEKNDRNTKGSSEYVWALKNINFQVQQGEVMGIIGKNGAGKSTLLKILSKVTAPTTGKITYRGRISSLLEVGTGFHQDLTGRENIYINGAILGMRKKEIENKFDEIVDFSGCERYIDTPVKRYSSGMTVRLGFAVAAFLEPEILVVDEVLAVGDAEFQKKAIGKMQDVSKNNGRTVLFVSHNMQSIKSLCKTAIIIELGEIREYGQVTSIVEHYLEETIKNQAEFEIPFNRMNGFANIENVQILNMEEELCSLIPLLQPFSIRCFVKINERQPHFILGLGFVTLDDIPLHTSFSNPIDINEGYYVFTFTEKSKWYASGKYKIIIGLSSREKAIQYIDDIVVIQFDDKFAKDKIVNTNTGYFLNQMEIDYKQL